MFSLKPVFSTVLHLQDWSIELNGERVGKVGKLFLMEADLAFEIR